MLYARPLRKITECDKQIKQLLHEQISNDENKKQHHIDKKFYKRINKNTRDVNINLLIRLNIPGLSIAVTRNDSIIYQSSFGYRNLETKEPMKVIYDFHWASVSKAFVATAIPSQRPEGISTK